MKLNSFTRISLLSLTISTLLLIGSSIDFSSKDTSQMQSQQGTDTAKAKGIRSLIDKAVVVEICGNASQYLQDIYAENKDTFDYEIKENKYADILKKFIKDRAISDIIDYWPRIIPFVVFILIAIFSIIGWLVCCCCCYCCCCPCCCCRQKENENCCRRCSFVVSLIMLGGIVAGAVAGLVYTGIFIEGINGATCSIMTFYYELKSGETRAEDDKNPRWLGIEGISKTITGTIDSVAVIQEKSKTAYNDPVLNGEKKFTDNLTFSMTTFGDDNLISPIPKISDTVTPIYIENYGPYKTDNTILNQIYKEYDLVVNKGVKEVNNTKGMTDTINTEAETIKKTLSDADSQINTLSQTFDDSVGTVIDQLQTYQDYFNEYANLILYLLFGLFLFIGIISLILISVYVGKCCYCGRGVLHFFWNFFALLSIITFIVGSVFGIIGLLGEDGSSILAYIFSAENLNSDDPLLFGGSETINTCLIGDGDLSKSLELDVGGAGQLDQLYQMSDTIKKTKAELQNYKISQSVKAVNDQLNGFKNNFRQSSTEAANSITELNRYTNGNTQNTYQTSNFKYDIWVANSGDCGGSSPPICRVIKFKDSFEINAIASEYDGIGKSDTTEYPTIKDAAAAYFTSLDDYRNANEKLIDDLVINNNGIGTLYSEHVTGLDTTLDKVNEVIEPLITVYGEVAGDNSIFSIINCKFLRKNLNIFISVMEKDLGNKTTVLAAIILAISFCETLSIIFVLIVLLRYKSQYIKKEPGNDDSSNNIIDPEPESNPEPQPVSDVPQQKQPEDIRVNSEEPKPQDLPVPILEKGDI